MKLFKGYILHPGTLVLFKGNTSDILYIMVKSIILFVLAHLWFTKHSKTRTLHPWARKHLNQFFSEKSLVNFINSILKSKLINQNFQGRRSDFSADTLNAFFLFTFLFLKTIKI